MKMLNRRDFLKFSSLAGAGLIAGGFALVGTGRASERSYFLLSDRPKADTEELLAMIDRPAGMPYQVTTRPAGPSTQDLTVIEAGNVIDPSKTNMLSNQLREFAIKLRSRESAGAYFVELEPKSSSSQGSVTFTVDGNIIEQIDLRSEYENIVIPGTQGDTGFSLKSGRLSVTYSACRHSVCEDMGSIQSGRIVCAPNKLVAAIDGHAGLDGLTG